MRWSCCFCAQTDQSESVSVVQVVGCWPRRKWLAPLEYVFTDVPLGTTLMLDLDLIQTDENHSYRDQEDDEQSIAKLRGRLRVFGWMAYMPLYFAVEPTPPLTAADLESVKTYERLKELIRAGQARTRPRKTRAQLCSAGSEGCSADLHARSHPAGTHHCLQRHQQDRPQQD